MHVGYGNTPSCKGFHNNVLSNQVSNRLAVPTATSKKAEITGKTGKTLTKFLCCKTAEPVQNSHVVRYPRYGNFFFLPPSAPLAFFSFLPQVLRELILVNIFSALSSLFSLSHPLIFFFCITLL